MEMKSKLFPLHYVGEENFIIHLDVAVITIIGNEPSSLPPHLTYIPDFLNYYALITLPYKSYFRNLFI